MHLPSLSERMGHFEIGEAGRIQRWKFGWAGRAKIEGRISVLRCEEFRDYFFNCHLLADMTRPRD
jgi:hypothetical protein